MRSLDFSKLRRETLRISFLEAKQAELLRGAESAKADLEREMEGRAIEEDIAAEREENAEEGVKRVRWREKRWLWRRRRACIKLKGSV